MHLTGWIIFLGIFTLFGLENCSAYLGMRELTALLQLIERHFKAGWYHVKVKNWFKLVEEITSKL